MDSAATIIVALIAALVVGLVIYRVARGPGSSGAGSATTRPGKPRTDWDTDPR